MIYNIRLAQILCAVGVLTNVLLAAHATAQVRSGVPRALSYQGVIAKNGIAASGQHDVQITLYDAPIGGSSVYSESQTVQLGAGGVFNLAIGSVVPLPDSLAFDRPYYMGVRIDGDAELTPRVALLSAPYAISAGRAELASGLTADARGVVTSFNELSGGLHLVGDSTVSVTSQGNTLVLSLTGKGIPKSGIQQLVNDDASIEIQNSSGPITSIHVADRGITSSKLNDMGAMLGQGLVWGGTGWYPQNILSSVAITDRLTGDASSSRPLDIAQQGATSGQALKWNGTSWAPANDSIGLTSVTVHAPELRGDGTTSNPIRLDSQNALMGQALKWNGASWSPANDSVGLTTVATHSPELIGDGTLAHPVTLAQQNATNAQVLKWSGASWSPANDSIGLTSVAVHTPELTGDGTLAAPIALASQNAASGQVLMWNGVSWSPSTLASSTVNVTARLTGNGSSVNPLDLAQQGAAMGQVLTWNGASWSPSTVNAGSGWQLTGNSTTTPWNGTSGNFIGTNDAQDLSIAAAAGAASAQSIRLWTGTASTERMRIAGNGNVGIGTQSPSQALEVAGNIRVSAPANSASQLQLQDSSASYTTSLQAGRQSASVTYVLPSSAPTAANQVLAVQTNANPVQLAWQNPSGGNASAWSITGNAGTTAGTNFIGTKDNQAFEIHIDDTIISTDLGRHRVMRYEPNATSANIIGGYSSNAVTSGAVGATIAGGGTLLAVNQVTDDYGTVSGGKMNQAGNGLGSTSDHSYATVGGGYHNTASGQFATIAGGDTLVASGLHSAALGGAGNTASDTAAVVSGGQDNAAQTHWSTVSGGYNNIAQGSALNGAGATYFGGYTTIGGGASNTASGAYATIAGGRSSTAYGEATTIVGGYHNVVHGNYAAIGGGFDNAEDSASSYTVSTSLLSGSNINGTGSFSVISGGAYNRARGHMITIAGGYADTAKGSFSTIGGGYENVIDSTTTTLLSLNGSFATIAGGAENRTAGGFSTVGGGFSNHIVIPATGTAGEGSTIAGGNYNTINASPISAEGYAGTYTTIGGGVANTAQGGSSTIAGGDFNATYGDLLLAGYSGGWQTVGGGVSNTCGGGAGTIAGGWFNTIGSNSSYSTIGGGASNNCGGSQSNTISGGYYNQIGSYVSYGTISGGYFNSMYGATQLTGNTYSIIGGGYNNVDSSSFGVIGGGYYNKLVGPMSAIAGGSCLKLTDSSFGFSAGGNRRWSSNMYPPRVTDLSNSQFKNVAYFGNVNMMIGNVDSIPRELRFYAPNADLTYATATYTSFKAGAQTGSITYTLPVTQGASSTFLMNDGTGTLSWNTAATAGVVSGSGAANQVAFWNGTSSITSSSGLYWDNTNARLGVGTTSPSATLSVSGSLAVTGGVSVGMSAIKTANYTATTGDYVVRANASGSNITITLPAASNAGQIIAVALAASSGSNAVTVSAATGDAIYDPSSKLPLSGNAGKMVTLVADGGTHWYVMNTNY